VSPAFRIRPEVFYFFIGIVTMRQKEMFNVGIGEMKQFLKTQVISLVMPRLHLATKSPNCRAESKAEDKINLCIGDFSQRSPLREFSPPQEDEKKKRPFKERILLTK